MDKFIIGYKILCKVAVLHRYFLNFGNIAFDTVFPNTDEGRRDRKVVDTIRMQYNINRFWLIEPTLITKQILKNQRMVFKNTPDGFLIGVETGGTNTPSVALPENLVLTFDVLPADGLFMMYTTIAKPVMDTLIKGADALIDGQMVRVNKVVKFKNTGAATAQTLNTGETINLTDLETYAPTEGGSRRPFGTIEIRHTPPTAQLLNAGNVVNNLVFTILLGNRTTTWRLGATDVGTLPLVANGRIPIAFDSKQLPNPTPSTTQFTGGNFVSMII
jgi:hypothetical protein